MLERLYERWFSWLMRDAIRVEDVETNVLDPDRLVSGVYVVSDGHRGVYVMIDGTGSGKRHESSCHFEDHDTMDVLTVEIDQDADLGDGSAYVKLKLPCQSWAMVKRTSKHESIVHVVPCGLAPHKSFDDWRVLYSLPAECHGESEVNHEP